MEYCQIFKLNSKNDQNKKEFYDKIRFELNENIRFECNEKIRFECHEKKKKIWISWKK